MTSREVGAPHRFPDAGLVPPERVGDRVRRAQAGATVLVGPCHVERRVDRRSVGEQGDGDDAGGADQEPDQQAPAPHEALDCGERQGDRGRCLEPRGDHEADAAAEPARSERPGQPEGHYESHEGVVVGTADHVDQDERIEGDQSGRGARVEAARGRHPRRQPGGAEHRKRRDALQHVDGRAQAQLREREGQDREQGPVGADHVAVVEQERQRRVPGYGLGCGLVGVEAVQGVQPGIGEVAEHVQREQGRSDREGQQQRADGPPEQAGGQRGCADEHRCVGDQGAALELDVVAARDAEAVAIGAAQPAGVIAEPDRRRDVWSGGGHGQAQDRERGEGDPADPGPRAHAGKLVARG